MQVFVSWSGTQSRNVATALKKWVPQMMAEKVDLFVSSEDIEKGERGLNKIADSLASSSFGIVVVTPDNQDSPWINFEAGALGKSVEESRLAPLLVGLGDVDVKGPLKQFQNTEASDEAAVRSLVHSINKTLPDSVAVGAIDVLFDNHWPNLKNEIDRSVPDSDAPESDVRPDSDLLVEILTTVRSLRRDVERLQIETESPQMKTLADFSDLVIHDLVTTLDLQEIQMGYSADGIEISLSEGTPPVSTTLQLRIRKLVRASGYSVKIGRPDGSWLLIDPNGRDSRNPATQSLVGDHVA